MRNRSYTPSAGIPLKWIPSMRSCFGLLSVIPRNGVAVISVECVDLAIKIREECQNGAIRWETKEPIQLEYCETPSSHSTSLFDTKGMSGILSRL